MKIIQLYTGCLAEAAYYIESAGEVAIIDPLRESEPYIKMAEKNGATIKYVLETHFHADFVSGHIDLAAKTGAQIVFGPTARPEFEAYIAKDNEVLNLGKIKIKVLHTPGHTMESSTFLLIDENGKEYAIFTGDTLFIGDVGRPDLAVKSDLSREDLAGYLFDSLHNKILPLPDNVIVYPGHGAGSACGKNMSKDTVDTLGHQKQFNYALRNISKAEFITEVTDGLVAPPQYFPKNAAMNKKGYASFDDILSKGMRPLSIDEFITVRETTEALVIDARKKEAFAEAHIPGAWYIGIEDSFAPWVGVLIKNLEQPILFLAEEGMEEEVVTRLSRVGYDNALGFLKGGMKTWVEAGYTTEKLEQINAEDFASKFENENLNLLDVRRKSEYDSEHLTGAENMPLDFIFENLSMVNPAQKYYIHCAGGYRSVIASSILQSKGINNVVNIMGGFKALSATSLPKTDYVAPKTML
jgi:glyoxylase-like metal-dependent hydrolase (beta-lactamase superfamily II)/rhodanese-related sulfurtransferase